ncbi:MULTISPECIES: transcription termination factor NusA [Shuttleworthella]|uniref:Transcription termination/antitermination protein NusA n=1 Tax=Shuttleworthella satelles DSM 14600 TaxID=626523 RepID=C4GBG0_9FIRM|nr:MULTISPECIES: transcription termination factor NusA [Shuttleworthia]EEP28453.1 transcription termination factor NusA [Shuttleworthia satelles DSM 14600]EUB17235.1 transcription termination factor NusA [Shuttleworthia sp. MSX8B]
MSNTDLLEALDALETERGISKEHILEAIEKSLVAACKVTYKFSDNATNLRAVVDRETGDFHVFVKKTVVDEVTNPQSEMSLEEAHDIDGSLNVGDTAEEELQSHDFSRIAASTAKNIMKQMILEEERKILLDEYIKIEHDIVTGVVQRFIGRNISVNLGKVDAFLPESEQVKGEHYHQSDRIRVYVLEVKDAAKGPRIRVSRTHPELVKRLFEEEVTEVKDGIVEIKAIAREAGSRTKMAVWSNDPDVDPLGACVGVNGSRVNAIVNELHNEKIDIINWNENPAMLIENALSPAKVIAVLADEDAREAKVVVPDYQLSLAIGKEGQNARLAARLTGYKIDIKSETQAQEAEGWLDYDEDYDDDYDEDAYEEDYEDDPSYEGEDSYDQQSDADDEEYDADFDEDDEA